MTKRIAIILAAGQGTRMKSPLPKVLHEVGGRSMLGWSVALAADLGCDRTIVVAGPGAEAVQAEAGRLIGPANVCVQAEQLGTANAVDAARGLLADEHGQAIVLYADTPLIPVEAGERAFAQLDGGASICVLGFDAAEPGKYGRLKRAADGSLEAIVEANDATEEELAITLCNSGVMAGPAKLMFELIAEVGNDNAKGEYYLTDLVKLARARGLKAAVAECDERDVLGVNSQAELAAAERVFQEQARAAFMRDGVTMPAPETVFLSWDTRIGPGAVVEQNVVLATRVEVAGGARIRAFSHLEGCKVEAGAVVGPYARLRPGAQIGVDAHIGNFVEVKNTIVGEGAKANHLSYLGDGDVGAGANIGAGTIFCNYDGFFKYRTVIGEGAFIGSNSALVAPVRVGKRGYVGSGSVITVDVEGGSLSIGRGRQIDKPGWGDEFRKQQTALKESGKKPNGAI